MGRPGVPSWVDAAGDPRHRRPGDPGAAGGEQWPDGGTVAGSSRMQAALSRGLAYALWGAIALALVLGLVNCAGLPGAGNAQPASDDQPPPLVAPPGGCAELVVSAWLAGDSDLLADVPGVPNGAPEPGRREATRTYTAAVTPGEGAWGYLIAADVRVRTEEADGAGGQADQLPGDAAESDGEGWQPAGTQFFRVTMVPTTAGGCQGWRPAALPAQVDPPALAGDPSTDPYDQQYPASLPVADTELSQTLEAFFSGMLAGGEDLERYLAPGVSVPAVTPPPYAEVSVTELRAREEPAAPVPADGTVAQLLVTVTTDADDLPLVYPVTVSVRGGRWEVVALDALVGTTVHPGGRGPAASGDPTAPDPGSPADPSNGG